MTTAALSGAGNDRLVMNPVLDHGYVGFVDLYGSDESILVGKGRTWNT